MKRLSKAFALHFQQETVSQWLLLNDGTLQALFKRNGAIWEAIFEVNGKLIRHSAVKTTNS